MNPLTDEAIIQAEKDGAIGSPNTAPPTRDAMSKSEPYRFYVEVPKRCIADYIQRLAESAMETLKTRNPEKMDAMEKRKHFSLLHSLLVTCEFITATDVKFAFDLPIQSKPAEEELYEVAERNTAALERLAEILQLAPPE